MRYLIIVKLQGKTVAEHTQTGQTSLEAIDKVESEHYGNPPEVNISEHKGHTTLVVSDWHGYTFEAKLQ